MEGQQHPAQAAHITIKTAPFYLKSPELWFRQLESQFILRGVTSDITRFHHTLAALPEDVACDVDMDVTSYETLKSAVLSNLKKNRHQLIEEALATVELGDRRPSQLVNDIQRKFKDVGLAPDDTIVKSRLISALPPTIRSALVGHEDTPLSTFAKIADSMLAVVGKETPFCTVNQVSHRGGDHHHPSSNNPHQHNSRHADQYACKYAQPRPFHHDQRPKICNAHIYYGGDARTCRPWCKWPGDKPKVLATNQKTPTQSRSSSPKN